MINKKSRLLVLDFPFVLALKKINIEKYSLVGGNIEKLETPLESIIRETKEEVLLNIKEKDVFLYKTLEEIKNKTLHKRHYFVLKNIKKNKFKLNEPNKFESLEWIDFFENKKKFKKLDKKVIIDIFSKKTPHL